MKHYAERDPVALGQHFANHMDAMTREGLEGKFEIAEELAWRDQQIENLKTVVREAHDALVQLVAFYNHTNLVKANQVTAKIREHLEMPPIYVLVTEIDPVKAAADKKALNRHK